MNCWYIRVFLVCVAVFLFPFRSPAPLIYRPGEGWSYESPSGKAADWRKLRAKDQLDVAQAAFDKKDYKLAMKAALRVVTSLAAVRLRAPGPISGWAAATRSASRMRRLSRPTMSCWRKYPKMQMPRKSRPANSPSPTASSPGNGSSFLAISRSSPPWTRRRRCIGDIVRFGPYGPYGPAAQMNIGAAREKQKDYALAVQAYEVAADRYSAQPEVAATALYKAALAWSKQARKADYDQSAASQAILSFNDFMVLYPQDPRMPEAQQIIATLKMEQARGDFSTAEYYEKSKHWAAAQIYYNSVRASVRGAPLADEATRRIEAISARLTGK